MMSPGATSSIRSLEIFDILPTVVGARQRVRPSPVRRRGGPLWREIYFCCYSCCYSVVGLLAEVGVAVAVVVTPAGHRAGRGLRVGVRSSHDRGVRPGLGGGDGGPGDPRKAKGGSGEDAGGDDGEGGAGDDAFLFDSFVCVEFSVFPPVFSGDDLRLPERGRGVCPPIGSRHGGTRCPPIGGT